MNSIGVIVEYNPFHNGHLYQLEKIKELYPNDCIIVILNGYFLERGLVSLESKKEKVRLALKYGANMVIELPFVFGSNSADIFSAASLELLDSLNCTKLVFGSESNDVSLLKEVALKQLDPGFDAIVKRYLDEGVNYPTALSKAIGITIDTPNNLLGISYIKAIIKNNYNIEPISIQRTNSYHDNTLDDKIVSASNIREKVYNNLDISKYIPEGNIVTVDEELFFNLLKYKIISEDNLDKYLTVDEGIDNKLKKVIMDCNNINELVDKVKTRRYTYNRLRRMFIHILLSFTKEDRESITTNTYIRLLGFDDLGQAYINENKKDFKLPLLTKVTNLDSKIFDYEIKAASLYKVLTNENTLDFEYSNRPLKKDNARD